MCTLGSWQPAFRWTKLQCEGKCYVFKTCLIKHKWHLCMHLFCPPVYKNLSLVSENVRDRGLGACNGFHGCFRLKWDNMITRKLWFSMLSSLLKCKLSLYAKKKGISKVRCSSREQQNNRSWWFVFSSDPNTVNIKRTNKNHCMKAFRKKYKNYNETNAVHAHT